jgi:polyisoprenoid-binding protein YceI
MTRKRRTWLVTGAAALLVVVGAGAYLYFSVFGGSAPAEVALSQPTASAASGSGTFDGSFDGTWTVDATSGSFSDFTDSFAGYRVQEELGSIGANTAAGRTPNVSGTLTIDGTTITAVDVTVDMTTLVSDDGWRDRSIHTRGLETDAFPTATFELTQPIDIGSVPTTGQTFQVDAVGNLTLHGVTHEVTVPIQGQWTGQRIEVVASFDVALADYSIQPPTGFLVLSIADSGTIEMHLLFETS